MVPLWPPLSLLCLTLCPCPFLCPPCWYSLCLPLLLEFSSLTLHGPPPYTYSLPPSRPSLWPQHPLQFMRSCAWETYTHPQFQPNLVHSLAVKVTVGSNTSTPLIIVWIRLPLLSPLPSRLTLPEMSRLPRIQQPWPWPPPRPPLSRLTCDIQRFFLCASIWDRRAIAQPDTRNYNMRQWNCLLNSDWWWPYRVSTLCPPFQCHQAILIPFSLPFSFAPDIYLS